MDNMNDIMNFTCDSQITLGSSRNLKIDVNEFSNDLVIDNLDYSLHMEENIRIIGNEQTQEKFSDLHNIIIEKDEIKNHGFITLSEKRRKKAIKRRKRIKEIKAIRNEFLEKIKKIESTKKIKMQKNRKKFNISNRTIIMSNINRVFQKINGHDKIRILSERVSCGVDEITRTLIDNCGSIKIIRPIYISGIRFPLMQKNAVNKRKNSKKKLYLLFVKLFLTAFGMGHINLKKPLDPDILGLIIAKMRKFESTKINSSVLESIYSLTSLKSKKELFEGKSNDKFLIEFSKIFASFNNKNSMKEKLSLLRDFVKLRHLIEGNRLKISERLINGISDTPDVLFQIILEQYIDSLIETVSCFKNDMRILLSHEMTSKSQFKSNRNQPDSMHDSETEITTDQNKSHKECPGLCFINDNGAVNDDFGSTTDTAIPFQSLENHSFQRSPDEVISQREVLTDSVNHNVSNDQKDKLICDQIEPNSQGYEAKNISVRSPIRIESFKNDNDFATLDLSNIDDREETFSYYVNQNSHPNENEFKKFDLIDPRKNFIENKSSVSQKIYTPQRANNLQYDCTGHFSSNLKCNLMRNNYDYSYYALRNDNQKNFNYLSVNDCKSSFDKIHDQSIDKFPKNNNLRTFDNRIVGINQFFSIPHDPLPAAPQKILLNQVCQIKTSDKKQIDQRNQQSIVGNEPSICGCPFIPNSNFTKNIVDHERKNFVWQHKIDPSSRDNFTVPHSEKFKNVIGFNQSESVVNIEKNLGIRDFSFMKTINNTSLNDKKKQTKRMKKFGGMFCSINDELESDEHYSSENELEFKDQRTQVLEPFSSLGRANDRRISESTSSCLHTGYNSIDNSIYRDMRTEKKNYEHFYNNFNNEILYANNPLPLYKTDCKDNFGILMNDHSRTIATKIRNSRREAGINGVVCRGNECAIPCSDNPDKISLNNSYSFNGFHNIYRSDDGRTYLKTSMNKGKSADNLGISSKFLDGIDSENPKVSDNYHSIRNENNPQDNPDAKIIKRIRVKNISEIPKVKCLSQSIQSVQILDGFPKTFTMPDSVFQNFNTQAINLNSISSSYPINHQQNQLRENLVAPIAPISSHSDLSQTYSNLLLVRQPLVTQFPQSQTIPSKIASSKTYSHGSYVNYS